MSKKKDHLTESGYQQILALKSGMNKGRKYLHYFFWLIVALIIVLI